MSAKESMNENLIGIAIVGLGFGEAVHLPALKANPKLQPIALWHPRSDRLREASNKHHIDLHLNWSSLLNDSKVKMVGVEAGGYGISSGLHSASISAGSKGVLHGSKTYLLQDKFGQIDETHSVSAGLDYPGVGPEHSFLNDINFASVSFNEYLSIRPFTYGELNFL